MREAWLSTAAKHLMHTHQKVSVDLGNIIVISWAHVKEAQQGVLMLGPSVDGIVAVMPAVADVHSPVMSCDPFLACGVRVSVRAPTHALHESLGTVLGPGFLQESSNNA